MKKRGRLIFSWFIFSAFLLFSSFAVSVVYAEEEWYSGFWNIDLPTETKRTDVIRDMSQFKPTNLPGETVWSSGAFGATLIITWKIIDIIIYISGVLAVIGVIVGGARYMFSFGWEGKEKAKTTLIWSLLGLVAVMLSYAIVHNVIRIILEASSSW